MKNISQANISDIGPLTQENGFAWVGSSQEDASESGMWASPAKHIAVSYLADDATVIVCKSDQEFAALLRQVDVLAREHQLDRGIINAGANTELRAAIERLGLGDMLRDNSF